MRKLKVGTRKSPLAMRQTEMVIESLKKIDNNLEFDIVGISTEGDRNQKALLSEIGGKGVFIKEVEQKLLDLEIDFAVHSLKDMPAILPEGLAFAAHPKREVPYDILVFKDENPLKNPDKIMKIGTGSIRRAKQLQKMYPNLIAVPIRGRVETRLKKLETENLDGVILAYAGLNRMNYLENLNYELLCPKDCVPAVGQGILGVECRMADQEIFDLLHQISDETTEQAALAEREFLALMNGNCEIPIGGLAEKFDDNWVFQAFLAKNENDPGKSVFLMGENPMTLAHEAFEQLK